MFLSELFRGKRSEGYTRIPLNLLVVTDDPNEGEIFERGHRSFGLSSCKVTNVSQASHFLSNGYRINAVVVAIPYVEPTLVQNLPQLAISRDALGEQIPIYLVGEDTNSLRCVALHLERQQSSEIPTFTKPYYLPDLFGKIRSTWVNQQQESNAGITHRINVR